MERRKYGRRMSIRDEVLAEIEAFLRTSRMTHTRFGFEVCNDPAFVARLRGGRDLKATAIDKVRAYIRNYRPPFVTGRRGKAEPRSAA